MKMVGSSEELNEKTISLCFACSEVGYLESLGGELSADEAEARNKLISAQGSMDPMEFLKDELLESYRVIHNAINDRERIDA